VKILDLNGVLKEFGLYGAQDVVDLGTGAGHLALVAAKRLEGGRLFAVDVERDMLKRLASEAQSAGLSNLHTLSGNASRERGVPLADMVMDRAIVASVLFTVDDKNAFIEETRRLLKPGGKVLFIEWRSDHSYGPHPRHKIAESDALVLFSRYGFVKERDVEAGDLHYGMIFIRT
jgi:ubiquinone/menaquinone biosynthesis C-methylase UbiE